MLIPTYVRLRYWFYPIGNTPAINLLRERAPVDGSATKILCLACGDVRNTLFTLSTELPSASRSYELTFCDSEPAILARNVFLFTFLDTDQSKDDETEASLLWELYYHIFIRSRAKNALARHTEHLLAVSRSSNDWNKSRYGMALKFYTEDTLREIRQYWQLYLNACDDRKEGDIRRAMREITKQHRLDDGRTFFSGSRAAGVHGFSSAAVMTEAFVGYWRTGVVGGNSKDLSALTQDNDGHANPLLYISSAPLGQFAVHYGTDPLHGFHLAEVFDAPGEEAEMLQRLASTAKSQFRGWCRSFTDHVRMGALRMFFHSGDAVNLCYQLQRHASINEIVPVHLYTYSRPWSSLCLDPTLGKRSDASCSFDVIDTSNISDHIGILNLLPAVQPLLNDNVFSVLYTETLLRTSENTTTYLDELLRMGVGSFGAIAGIAPTASLMGITSEHFGLEAFLSHPGQDRGSQSQLRVRISWMRPSSGDHLAAPVVTPVIFADVDDLASVLFKCYLDMFSASEDLSIQLSVHLRRAVNPLSHDLGHYTRTTLIALIGLARKHVQTDWPKCIELLVNKIQDDKTLIVGSNSWQELYMLLHMAGMYRASALDLPPKTAAINFSAIVSSDNMEYQAQWSELPSIVAVALIVPRERLAVFTSADLSRIGTPGLHLAVYNESLFENSFHAIHTCFGKLIVADDNQTSIIDEDALGWRGHSELIVTCLVPAFQFLVGRQVDTRVALVVNSSGANAYFFPILGLHLRVFATRIDNRQNFHILPTLPSARQSQQRPPIPTLQSHRPDESIASVTPRDGRLELLTLRTEISSNVGRDSLRNGSKIQVVQESPCTMVLQLGKQCQRLRFPFPVDGSHSRTRIARKQCWIEVIVPISFGANADGYALRPFPIVFEKGQAIAWGMSRINLDRSPIMADISLKQMSGFLAMTLSTKERDSRPSPSKEMEFSRSLFEMKESLAALFTSYASQDNSSGRKWQAFRLAVQNDSDTLVLVNSLRHDQDMGSICLDAHVVPLNNQRIQQISGLLTKIVGSCQILSIKVSEREEVLWKHTMPALVERCRRIWQHRPACEYMTPMGQCPRSLLHGQIAICSCGEGQDVGSIAREFRGFSRFATRIAISPLSAVPFVEPMALDAVLSSVGGSLSSAPRGPQKTPQGRQQHTCGHCRSSESSLRMCTGCKSVKYCSKSCQSLAWTSHKLECRSKRVQGP